MKNRRGITLISLGITVIVLLIITTSFTYNMDEYFENRQREEIMADLTNITEKVEHYYAENKQLPILNKYTNLENLKNVISPNDNENYYVVDLDKIGGITNMSLNYGIDGYEEVKGKDESETITDITDIFIVNEQSHIIYYPEGVGEDENIIYTIPEDISETQSAKPDIKIDGSWNANKKVNTPKLKGTGLIPIYWDENGKEIELTKESPVTEWEKWYDYEKQEWANAITKDEYGNTTGYFVWIPRYAYKIKSGLGTSTAGEIEVVFVDINNKNGNTTYLETYPTVENNAMTDFVVHPAFTKDVENGGWDKDIEGFWVAKYEAGYQANTITVYDDGSLSTDISNSTDTVVYSDEVYTSINTDYTTNPLGQALTKDVTQISYPVFKPLTYSYNNISISDTYTISRQIQKAKTFYGLYNIDSHMQKNSEWGAVVYLTQSEYGRNTVEVNINNYYTSTASPYRVTVTGVYGDSEDEGATNAISVVNAYNTTIGQKGSSTGNIYGVYDLNGGTWERVADIVNSGHKNLLLYGKALLDEANVSYKISESIVTTKTGNNTKYVTIYQRGTSSSDLNKQCENNYQKNAIIYGGAIMETSTNGTGNTSWYGDYSQFIASYAPFLNRSGVYNIDASAGLYCFYYGSGGSVYSSGFRVVLIAE